MNKREARKAVLRWSAALIRSKVSDMGAANNLDEIDLKRAKAAAEHLADHLEWEADGRPERA